MLQTLLLALVGAAAAQASPGPSLMAVASAAITDGRRAAIIVTLGISLGILIWGVAIPFGLGTLIQTHPILLIAMKILGGGYLIWLAFKGVSGAVKGQAFEVSNSQ